MNQAETESTSADNRLQSGVDASISTASKGAWVAWLPVAVFCAVTLPLIFGNYHAGRAEADQSYHLRAIRQFADQWPRFDFRDYASTTTPGFHLVLATVAHFVTSHIVILRLIGWLFSLGMVIELTRHAKPLGAWTAAFICLPFVVSLYVVSSAAWVLPDNAGWWGVLAVLAIAMRPRFDWKSIVFGAGLLLALVLVRQVHLWAAAVLWGAAWFGNGNESKGREKRVAFMIVATLPAFIAIGVFASIWKGLTPPSMADEIYHAWYSPENRILTAPNFATPAGVLAVFGATSIFFVEFLRPFQKRLFEHAGWIGLGLIVGIFSALIPPTDYASGSRSSGIWNLSVHFPVFMHRSLFIAALAGGGGALLAAWGIAMAPRYRWLWGIAWVAFIAANLPNPSAFQRYFEPFCLMTLVLAAAQLSATHPIRRPVWKGPVLLAIFLGLVTYASLRR